MDLGMLIARLERHRPDVVIPYGFGSAHSYRGYYGDVAFEPERDVTIGSMLEHARAAVGTTFEGYKGGEYTMDEYTACWIATYGDTGESIGPTLLNMWDAWIYEHA